MRKEDEKILGEDIDWQMADAARQEVEDGEAELRLLQEEIDAEELVLAEEIMNMEEYVETCGHAAAPRSPSSDPAAAGPRSGQGTEEELSIQRDPAATQQRRRTSTRS